MRRITAAAAAAVLGGLGVLALAPSANAASACLELHLNINGTVVEQSTCLPPEGAPGVPELPPLPA